MGWLFRSNLRFILAQWPKSASSTLHTFFFRIRKIGQVLGGVNEKDQVYSKAHMALNFILKAHLPQLIYCIHRTYQTKYSSCQNKMWVFTNNRCLTSLNKLKKIF